MPRLPCLALFALSACTSHATPHDAATSDAADDAVVIDDAALDASDATDASDAAPPTCDPDAWRDETLPGDGLAGTDVSGIHGTSADDVWVVTVTGRTFHLGAGTWSQTEDTALGTIPRAVWAADAQNVWVVGQRGYVARYDADLGWVTERDRDDTDGIAELLSVHGVSSEDVWAVGYTATGESVVLHREDDATWSRVAAPSMSESLSSVFAVGAGHVWVSGGGGLFELSGGAWTLRTARKPFRDVVVLGGGDLVAIDNTPGVTKPLCHAFGDPVGCVAFPGATNAGGIDLSVMGDTVLAVANEIGNGDLSTRFAELRGGAWTGGRVASGFPKAVWGVEGLALIGGSERLLRRGCD